MPTSHLDRRCSTRRGFTLIEVLVVMSVGFGSLPVAIRYVRGERLIVEPVRFKLRGLKVDPPRTVATYVRNFTGRPVKLLGASTRCACVFAQDLPTNVAAGETRRLDLKVRSLPNKTELDQTIVIFTDCPEGSRLAIQVQGSSR